MWYKPKCLKALAKETEQLPTCNRGNMGSSETVKLCTTREPSPAVPSDQGPNHPAPIGTPAQQEVPRGRPMDEDSDEQEEVVRKRGVVVENGIKYATGEVSIHHLPKLTTFWDNQIREIKGYVPILMFNHSWLERKAQVQNKKAIKKKKKDEEESDEEKYEGLNYPAEQRLT
ncbi:uncharacterized protein MELLADRAFT_110076 [Melampsora larici-populina 98AG31]|uniref:Uncharacterized protein n=1 Tax=Melampsora larici-populina (strain 98AG31 / pathotype 3-4-7) TaxID=747676 RepID=F4RYK7_MELLP|nr:uncharacterized protein MELLADRAFT_110076 [Melampsora larici-populina 98AG31]EGG02489.1 hypothetical protein MELLADRAFT_110076 [Melampsora larici-populina 98AG31]